MDLFSSISKEPEIIKLDMADADVKYFPSFFKKQESDKFYKLLLDNILWQQDFIKFYGKEIPLPRLTAWYGESDKSYTYSGIPMKPHHWNNELLEIKKRIEDISSVEFTSVLLNLYRNGNDSVS